MQQNTAETRSPRLIAVALVLGSLLYLLFWIHLAWSQQTASRTPGTIITSAGQTIGPKYSEEELNNITSFTPSPTISAQIKKTVLNHYLDTVSPTAKRQLREAFADLDILNYFLVGLAEEGYQVNDLAVALTAWATTAFGILEERVISSAQDRALWQQFRIGLAKNPDFALAEDAQKQKIAEELYWLSALFTYQYQQLQAGAAWIDIRKLREDISKSLRTRAINPRTMTITNKGLVHKKGS